MSKSEAVEVFTRWALGILFAGNLFFLKRLVDKIDDIEKITWALRQQVVVLEATYKTHTGGTNGTSEKGNLSCKRN